jgi:ribosomal protein L28
MSNSRRSTKRTQNDSYQTVAKNIYRDGSSYRARVSVDGIRYSRNCRTKREAIEWRNEMIADRA